MTVRFARTSTVIMAYLRDRPSIKMRQTIKWYSAVCLTIVRPIMFRLLQSLLIFYQTNHFGQAISLLPNMYSIGKLRQKRPQQEHTSPNHLQVLFPTPVYFSHKSFKQTLLIVNFWELAMPVLPTIMLIMLSAADSMVSCQGRVGIILNKTDYFGNKKHVWQTNIVSAKCLVLTN